MADDVDRAVDARLESFLPGTIPSFATLEARKRNRDRRRLVTGAVLSVAAVAGALAVLPALDAGGDRLSPERAAASNLPEPTTTTTRLDPSPYPYEDCDALRPGDPLDLTDVVCDPEGVTQASSIDCVDGIYIRLARSGLGDLEGIVGRTPFWRAAAPTDPVHGRTPWALDNCAERG